MISFLDVMSIADKGTGPHTAFWDMECRVYYDLLAGLKPGSVILEIGLQFGRSSSIALRMTKELGLIYHGIDYFQEPPEAKERWLHQAEMIDAPYALHEMNSRDAESVLGGLTIDLALIDGDHSADGVTADCALVLPKVPVGGHVLFHDWLNYGCPEVTPAVLKVFENLPGWTMTDMTWTLATWRRNA